MAKSDTNEVPVEAPPVESAPAPSAPAAPELPVLNDKESRLTGDLGGMQPGLAPGEYALPNGLKVVTN